VSLRFQSLRSSSAGNCLALWTPASSILIDCGVKVQRDFREMLEAHRRRAGHLDAVVVSHAHGDHAAYGSLRVLAREGIPVLADRSAIAHVRDTQAPQEWRDQLRLHAFARTGFLAGDFHLRPIEVPHTPGVTTFGFVITVRDHAGTRTVVVCTDFNDYSGVLPHFAGADLIFVEANHDLALLRQHPNPNSRYHLNNAKTASLLQHAVAGSAGPPRAVMLGHLSEERNRRVLALGEVTRLFARQATPMRFHLDAAPARRESEVIEI